MAKYIINRGIKRTDRQAALDLIKADGGQLVEIHPLGTIVECTPEMAEALELVPIVNVSYS